MSKRISTGKYLRPLIKYRQAKTPEEYLIQRLDKTSECWIFTGSLDKDGYGQCHSARVAKEKSVTRSHQLAYVTWKGEIPKGMMVCHTCDNPSCCNPDHLFLGTAQDNNDDMWDKGRWKSGSKPRFDHQYIVSQHKRKSSMELSDELGCSFSLICQVWREHGLEGRHH